MARNRLADHLMTAPLWQVFSYSAVGFVLLWVLIGLIQSGGSMLGVIVGAIGGLIFGIPFGGSATWLVVRLRQERRATGAANKSQLKRALRDGWLPQDEEEAHGLARLIAWRRLQCRRTLKINLPFTVVLIMVLNVVDIVFGAINWVGLVLGVLVIGLAAFTFVRLRHLLRKLDQLAGRLPPVEGPGDTA